VADLARLTGYGRENIKRIVGSTRPGDDDEQP
jgi:hypothetical protein